MMRSASALSFFSLVLALGCAAPTTDTDAMVVGADSGADGSVGDGGRDAAMPDARADAWRIDDAAATDDAADAGTEIDASDVGIDAAASCSAGETLCGASCVDLSHDAHHCGACDVDCTMLPGVDGARVTCTGGACDVASACTTGHANCTVDPLDGCATDITMPAHCGDCAIACSEPAPFCSVGAAGTYACASGCGGATPTRCGTTCVDTTTDPAHCGSCTNACPAPDHGSATCASSTCGTACASSDHLCGSACVPSSDPMTCGTSCTPCTAPTGGSATCDGTSCGTSCPGGTHLCGNTCASNGSPATCGSSCSYCSYPTNAMATCDGTTCGFTCYSGYHLCGGQCPPTDAPYACGPSCTACASPAHGSATCDGTSCGFRCDPGYAASGATCSPVPRPLAPLSTGTVTSRRPTLRWVAATGIADTTVDLCTNRACTSVISSTHVASGTSFAPSADLPIGVVFWRLHPGVSTTLAGPTWSFTVGVRSAPIDASWGSTLDVNGDGLSDVAVGAAGGSSTPPGSVLVYLGTTTGLATAATWTITDAGGTGLGSSVASAGDVNGDGYADLIVGTPRNGRGGAQIYFGSATGLSTSPSWSASVPTTAGSFGQAVSGVGDVNGDGYADVGIGAPSSNGGAGALYFWYGSANGPSTNPIPDRAYTGFSSSFPWYLGRSVSSGDANGDGYTDVLAGIPGNSGGGGVYVYYGSATGLPFGSGTLIPPATSMTGAEFGDAVACADVNADGYADLLVGEPMFTTATGQAHLYLGSASGIPGSPVWSQTGSAMRVAFGEALASAGDVNGDGYADVIIGAPSDTTSGGAAFVYLGAPGGLGTTVVWTVSGSASSGGQQFGGAVAGIGDVTRDGRADVMVGVPGDFPGGRAMIYPGTATAVSTTAVWTTIGASGARYGSAIAH